MRHMLLLIVTVILGGCLATGSTVMLNGAPPENPTKTAVQIELLLEPPAKAYTVIALVTASAKTQFGDVAGAEGSALEQLKAQAAAAGADAVMDIERQVLSGGQVVSSGAYGRSAGTAASRQGVAFGSGAFTAQYYISFNAKAIKYR